MFIHIEKFYEKPNELFEIISKLDFKENLYGDEIKDFNMISQGIENAFSAILNQKVAVTKDSGRFRKPYAPIHFENFNENSLYTAIVALEDTNIKTYKHKETGYTNVFPITEDINLHAGNMILIKPWVWHGLDNKLVKVFYLEKATDGDEVQVQLQQPDS
jgi:predicted P-loop ATPase